MEAETNLIRQTGSQLRLIALGLTAWLLLGTFGRTAHAATIVVDTTADDEVVNGNCTYLEAMLSARDDVVKGNCLRGLAIGNFTYGVVLSGEIAPNNAIQAC